MDGTTEHEGDGAPTIARRVTALRCVKRMRGHGLLAAVLVLGCVWHQAVMAQIYAGTSDADGAVVLSNFPSADTPDVLIAKPEAPPLAVVPVNVTVVRTQAVAPPKPRASAELNRLIDSVAAQVKVPADLLHAVITVESNYDLKARSPKGAIGLMQLLPATAKRFGAKDPYVASDNVTAGAGYLKWLMALFHDDLELVLAAYNAGEQAVIKAGGKIPPFPETQAYVPRVMAYLQNATKSPR